MCLCMYKIYILYYLDFLAFSAKRVKKNFGTRFFVLELVFLKNMIYSVILFLSSTNYSNFILFFRKKETHAVVYTGKSNKFPVFSECSRPHPVGVQAPSLFFIQ